MESFVGFGEILALLIIASAVTVYFFYKASHFKKAVESFSKAVDLAKNIKNSRLKSFEEHLEKAKCVWNGISFVFFN